MEFHEITLVRFPPMRYIASDGKIFTNKIEYLYYQNDIHSKQMIWYEKRFSWWGMLMYSLFKKEPDGRQY